MMNNKSKFLLFTLSFLSRRSNILLAFLCVGGLIFPLSLLFAENHMDLMQTLVGEHRDSRFGYSTASLDFNGDSTDDLVVGSRGWDPDYYVTGNTTNIGKLYFYFGKEENFADSADFTISGFRNDDSTFTKLGTHLENLGDMNNDGFEDLGFYNLTKDDEGHIYMQIDILPGNADCDTIPNYVYTLPCSLYQNDGGFSGFIRPLGDINNDSYDDAGVVFKGQDDIYYFYLIFGNEFELIYLCQYPHTSGWYSGANIYGIGDVNNDGFDDFMIGYGLSSESTYHNFLYFGDTIIDSVADLVIDDVPYLSTAGGLPCGDWDGDSIDDFVGYCCYDQGVCVWLGHETGNLQPGTFVEYFSSLGNYKRYDYGDLNNDGKDDILIGLPTYGGGSGRIYIYLGGYNGVCDLNIGSIDIRGNLGWDITVGDYNNDGYADAAFGAPAFDGNNMSWNGKVWIYAGNEELEDTTVGTEDPNILPVPAIEFNAYPNPFNPSITFTVKFSNEPVSAELRHGRQNQQYEQIQIEIFNVKGQKVKTLKIGNCKLKIENLTWKAEDQSSGIYFCKLVNIETGAILSVKKVTLMK